MANYSNVVKTIKDSNFTIEQYRELRAVINEKIKPLAEAQKAQRAEEYKAKREENKSEWAKNLKPYALPSPDGKKLLVYEAYNIKSQLKELGASYSNKDKAWTLPRNQFFIDELKKLIAA